MRPEIPKWLGVAAALFLLNSALSFHNIWPTPWIKVRPELSVEVAALIVLLAIIIRVRGEISKPLLVTLSVILSFLALGRYMEVTAPALYGRAINLYWDAQHLPAVAAMLVDAAPLYLVAAVLAGIVAVLGLLLATLFWSLSRVARFIEDGRPSGLLPISAAAVVALYLLSYNSSLPTLRWFSIPVSQTYARQLEFVVSAATSGTATDIVGESVLRDTDIDSLPRTDVIVAFIESYGAVAYDGEAMGTTLDAARRQFVAAADESGRRVASALVEAPTFGGGSWLSHISFMTGLEVDDPAIYDALLTQEHQTLPKLFRDAGFRAVALMPGLRNAWPEGSFYGFDRIYGARELDYRGPEFGWWRIPDQYALARLDSLEPGADGRPLFVFFPTISTHTPFRPTPPYQKDWQQLLSDDPYTADQLGRRLAAEPDWLNLRPSYADAVAYTYAYWAGYLGLDREREFLLVLIGDHQPPASISGTDAPWHVPVHVVTRDEALTEHLLASGFSPGMAPGEQPVARMHEVGGLLLQRRVADDGPGSRAGGDRL